LSGQDVGNVRLATIDRVGLPGVNLETGRSEASVREFDGEWETDVPQTDYANARCACRYFVQQLLFVVSHRKYFPFSVRFYETVRLTGETEEALQGG
jgi:hypothetical protein